MSDKATLLALADRIEALTGPCRETDVAVALAKGWMQTGDGWFRPANVDVRHHITEMPRYTASLDAAMTLVPEGWWLAGMHFCPVDFRSELDREYHAEVAGPITWGVIEHGCPEEPQYECEGGNAATPALALTAAALRALANGGSDE